MTKREFLSELRRKLNDQLYEDVDGVIDYYNELIEDTIDRTGKLDSEVISDLGEIDLIVKKITGKEVKKQKIKYEEVDESTTTTQTTKNNDNKIVKTILIICTAPLWIAGIAGLIGVVVGIYAALGSMVITGGYFLINSFIMTNSTVGNIIGSIGIGLILISLGVILIPLFTKGVIEIHKGIKKGINWLASKFD